eukprot:TRINITY_DN3772_c0_g1_i1.p1 TRINITY_DN3772_c0_g1~~TRINITY_DN3772_c0_g1_i1.p1  ORF type:complete len:485 (+),score=115.59 TRINITY_DN3772_c0_g1_i1:177-1631(+)
MEPLIAMEKENETEVKIAKTETSDSIDKSSTENSQQETKSRFSKYDADEFVDFLTSESGTSVAYGLVETAPFKEGVQIAEAAAGLHSLRRDRTDSFLRLVKFSITSEISKQAQENTILRGNSVCTKFMSACTQIYGDEYLRQVFAHHIKEVCEKEPLVELDPNKMKVEENLATNQELLSEYCQKFFDSIVASLPSCPHELRLVCKHLAYEVNKRFPEGGIGRRALAAFFFLRFLCPAIFLPATHGLIPAPPTPTANRSLTLISKTIQSLASGSEGFSVKESFLAVMKDFIIKNRATLNNFLDELPNVDDSRTKVETTTDDSKGKEKDEDDSPREEVRVKRAATDTNLIPKPTGKASDPSPKKAAHIDTLIGAITTHKEALEKFLSDEANFKEDEIAQNKESVEILNGFLAHLKKAPTPLKEMGLNLRASSPSIMDSSSTKKGKRESRRERRARERASKEEKKRESALTASSSSSSASSRRCIIL